jgi:hypothetical protein
MPASFFDFSGVSHRKNNIVILSPHHLRAKHLNLYVLPPDGLPIFH